MAEDVDYRHHGRVLLKNPAWARMLEDERAQWVKTIERTSNTEERMHACDMLAVLANLERRARNLGDTGRIEAFHREQMSKTA